MGNSSRKARRQARRAKRKERRKLLRELIEKLSGRDISFEISDKEGANPPFIQIFKEIWPILDPALKFLIAMRLTKERVDKVLEDIHKAGQLLASGGAEHENEFREKFRNVWDDIEPKLEFIQIVTPNKVDKVLDDIIEIGDWIAGE
ncbi:MAG: hypothetical protein ABJF04_07095 [Reichenbachiella sp.]|uniref:hypothetical protein n=1 Tax=Reichenbachiella sp. TaxID=2184521 RepID=UPI0032635334